MQGDPMVQAMFGERAVHIPAWFYAQGDRDVVSFVGASRAPGVHPLTYGSNRQHRLIVGEIVVRPHFIVATDTLRGMGLAGLAQSDHNVRRMLADGEILWDPMGRAATEAPNAT